MKLLMTTLIFIVALTGCSNSSNTNETTTEDTSQTQQILELDSEVQEIQDTAVEMTGSAESTAFSPYTSTAKVTVIGDDITDVEFEEFLEDGTSKNEASKNGTYTSPNYTLGEFYEQIDSLEAYVIEHDRFPPLTNGSDVDAVSGASLNLSGFEDAFNQAVTNAK